MTSKLNNDAIYVSSDLGLVTAASLYFPIESIDRSDPHKTKFTFLRNKGLDDFIEVYWKKETRIEPQTYFSQLRFIKSRLYENK